MTIPPASERAVRPCDDCTFMDFEYTSCRLFDGMLECPCDYNFTQGEMKELIDQHNQQEQLLAKPRKLTLKNIDDTVIIRYRHEQLQGSANTCKVCSKEQQ